MVNLDFQIALRLYDNSLFRVSENSGKSAEMQAGSGSKKS
jgi:hypothetical protein